jgi:S-adenosylmethionine decarboxylase
MENKLDNFFFGVHFMVDGYNAPSDTLLDVFALKSALSEIPKNMGMHTITEPVVVEAGPNNKKDPGGLSGVVLIAESHFSFHTFPARGFVTIDVYTCKDALDTEKLLSELRCVFSFTEEETYLIERGRNYPKSNIY